MKNSIIKKFNKKCLTASILSAVLLSQTQAVPLPDGSALNIDMGVGSAANTACTAGSCFAMEVAPGFIAWTDVEPGTDGGFIVGKSQASGGQELGPSASNTTSGELTAAWKFFGNFGTFYIADGTFNVFDDASCAGPACIGRTALGVYNFAWNGNIIPMGSAGGCNSPACSPEELAGDFITDYQMAGNGAPWSIHFHNVVPNGDASFGDVKFQMIARGTVTLPTPTPSLTASLTVANIDPAYGKLQQGSAAESMTMLISGTLDNGNQRLASSSVTISGQRISVEVYLETGLASQSNLNLPFSTSVNLGILPAGAYTFDVLLMLDGVKLDQLPGGFDVISRAGLLPKGTVLSIESGEIPGSTTTCAATGSCMTIDPQALPFYVPLKPGLDGGIVIGKNQNPSTVFNNPDVPGEIDQSTNKILGGYLTNWIPDSALNRFNDGSGFSSEPAIIGSWDFQWNETRSIASTSCLGTGLTNLMMDQWTLVDGRFTLDFSANLPGEGGFGCDPTIVLLGWHYEGTAPNIVCNPKTSFPGDNISVACTAVTFDFIQNMIVPNLGSDITVNNITVNEPKQTFFDIAVSAQATLGKRTLEIPYGFVYYSTPFYVLDPTGDEDADGLSNARERQLGTDPFDPDTDADGQLDGLENAMLTAALDYRDTPDPIGDADSDGLTNQQEAQVGTNPFAADTDGDGQFDDIEITLGSDPIDPASTTDLGADADNDGLNNGDEYTAQTDPFNPDTDNDGLLDGEEVFAGADGYVTNPLNADTDFDTLTDSEEVTPGTDGYVTDPTTDDTDGDGLADAAEIRGHVVSQITFDEPNHASNPDIWNGEIVWYSGVDNYSVRRYLNGEITQLTRGFARTPAIHNGVIGWSAQSDGPFLYRDGVTTLIGPGGLTTIGLHIFNDWVVFSRFITIGNYDVYLYDGVTTRRLSNTAITESETDLHGKQIVWTKPHPDGYRQLTLYDNGTYNMLSGLPGIGDIAPPASTSAGLMPNVRNGNVVWRAYDGNDFEIYWYDGETTRQITNNDVDDSGPVIQDNVIIWSSHDGNDYELVRLQDGVIQQITDNQGDDINPTIWNKHVVWSEVTGNISFIKVFDGKTVQELGQDESFGAATALQNQQTVFVGADGEIRRAWLGREVPTDPSNSDTDNDTVADAIDNCPIIANTGQRDTDANGLGDACELPSISGFWPGDASQSNLVFLFGRNFSDGMSVSVNGQTSPLTHVIDGSMSIFMLPSGNTSGPISVTTNVGTATSSTDFGQIAQGLAVTGTWPLIATPGQFVFVFGSRFEAMNTSVSIGGVPAPLMQVISEDMLLFQVPSSAVTGAVKITTSTSTVTSAESVTIRLVY